MQLAKRLDLDERQVRRLQDPATSSRSRLPEIDRAIDVLDQRLEVRLVSKTPKNKGRSGAETACHRLTLPRPAAQWDFRNTSYSVLF
jgi:hypothetical protein